jgi:hypothetical protein
MPPVWLAAEYSPIHSPTDRPWYRGSQRRSAQRRHPPRRGRRRQLPGAWASEPSFCLSGYLRRRINTRELRAAAVWASNRGSRFPNPWLSSRETLDARQGTAPEGGSGVNLDLQASLAVLDSGRGFAGAKGASTRNPSNTPAGGPPGWWRSLLIRRDIENHPYPPPENALHADHRPALSGAVGPGVPRRHCGGGLRSRMRLHCRSSADEFRPSSDPDA